MTKKRDFIPASEEQFFDWQNNFAIKTAAGAATWAIPTATLTALQTLQSDYLKKYDVANKGKKASRTQKQVKEKDEAILVYQAAIRQLVKEHLAFNIAITDADRLELGITVRDSIRTRSTRPDTIPVTVVQPLSGSSLKITVRQAPAADGTSRRGKPANVSAFEIAAWVGPGAPVDGEACTIKDRYSRSPVVLELNAMDAGKTASIFTRWIGNNGQAGSWGNAVEEVISK